MAGQPRPALSLRTLLPLGSVAAMLLTGCASDEPADNDRPAATAAPTTQPDLDAAMVLAMEAAESHPAVDFPPHSASDAAAQRPHLGDGEAFGEHHFVYVWSDLGHTENSPFAVSPEGAVFKLPEEFDQLARDERLVLTDEEQARGLLDFYLDFHTAMPGTDRLVVLDDITDVPGIDDEHVRLHGDVVEAMRVIPGPDGWTFEFCSWQAVGGTLRLWRIELSRAGEAAVERKETLGEGLGDFVTIE